MRGHSYLALEYCVRTHGAFVSHQSKVRLPDAGVGLSIGGIWGRCWPQSAPPTVFALLLLARGSSLTGAGARFPCSSNGEGQRVRPLPSDQRQEAAVAVAVSLAGEEFPSQRDVIRQPPFGTAPCSESRRDLGSAPERLRGVS